ncbi:MAG: mannitol dehydrogenase family protein [Betaproteobacteria bacterium]|nr:mannitol dehydrogenase family protein [Betaproteobacteria bacterium]
MRHPDVNAPRLSFATLAAAAAGVVRPGYAPERLQVGIVHLGIGAFHRAHQALYTDDALARAGGAWGICGVSLRSADVRDRLAPQDCLYTSVEVSPAGVRRRVVGSVREVLFLGDQRLDVHRRLAARETRIITLTVTEKGYCHEPATGKLDFAHPDIVHDLVQPDASRSVVGLLTWALAQRRATHGAPLTLVCCDNLPHNGALLRGLVDAFARARDPALADWIARTIAFPSTMVDRIVPATTADDIARNDAALGLEDRAPVVHEPFIQWVIEDAFATERPAWELAGATLTDDVAPFESMKLRLLNASHSAFAYLGFLAGHEYIYQVAAQPDFIALMRRYTAVEVSPTLKIPAGVDVAAYCEALERRFANPALPHRTTQIAMDGSQKLPQRILATVRANLAAGRPVELAALAVAGWMRYVRGDDEHGQPIRVSDPLASRFASIATGSGKDPVAYARGLLALSPIFGDDLPDDARFTGPVIRWLGALFSDGAAATVARAVRA